MRKLLAGAVVLLVVLGVLTALRAMQRDACFTGGGASGGYNGLTVAEAEERAVSKGYILRVVGRGGECFAVTSDFRDDRVNVYVEGGEVAQSRNY